MNDLGKALAIPVPCTIGGQLYQVSLLTKRVQGEFSVWLKSRDREALLASLHGAPPEAAAQALMLFKDDMNATETVELPSPNGQPLTMTVGRYAMGSAKCTEALMNSDGQVYLFWLLLKKHQPATTIDNVIDLLAEYPEDVANAINAVIEAGKQNPQAIR